MQESDKNYLELHGEDPVTIEAMLRFIYGFEYFKCVNNLTGSPGDASIILQVRLYQAADKYFVPELKQAAKDRITKFVKNDPWSIELINAIPEVYSRTSPHDQDLRPIFVRASIEHIHELFQSEQFLAVLENTRGFITDLAKKMDLAFVKYLSPRSRSLCQRCQNRSMVRVEKCKCVVCLICGGIQKD